jgi:hypothetical protein
MAPRLPNCRLMHPRIEDVWRSKRSANLWCHSGDVGAAGQRKVRTAVGKKPVENILHGFPVGVVATPPALIEDRDR